MSNILHKCISTLKSPRAIGPYNQGILVNDTLYISGQLGLVAQTMKFAGEDVESQTRQSLNNIQEIVQAAGGSMRNIVKTTILFADINDFERVNMIYEQYFFHPYPARAAYEVARLPKNGKIEIEAVAVIKDSG